MVVADISVVPLVPVESEEEMYDCVDQVIEHIKESGLNYEVGANSTTIEGEYEEVFAVAKEIHRLPFQEGFERVVTTIRIDEKKSDLSIEEKTGKHREE